MTTARHTTPPMGWNSWDSYGTTVTESEVLANAEFMAEHLLVHGWDTVVVDIAWYDPTARSHGYNADAPVSLDEHGRPMPAPNRFPSSTDGAGFRPLASAVHDLGLRFGVHIMRGIPRHAVHQNLPVAGTDLRAADVANTSDTCVWNPDNYGLNHDHPGAQAYYDAFVAQLAAWGVDFIKADDLLWPYRRADIEALALAIERSGRDIQLSLSPGRDLSTEHAEHLAQHCTMWRISDDLWDRWPDVMEQFGRLSRWSRYAQEGAWVDADMLPLGHIGIRAERGEDRHSLLSADEQQTLMTLWIIARSPLMMGGDLPTSSAETIALLSNPGVLDVLKAGRDPREVLAERERILWVSVADDGRRFVGVFNVADEPAQIEVRAEQIGAAAGSPVTELWGSTELSWDEEALLVSLPAHGSALLEISQG